MWTYSTGLTVFNKKDSDNRVSDSLCDHKNVLRLRISNADWEVKYIKDWIMTQSGLQLLEVE